MSEIVLTEKNGNFIVSFGTVNVGEFYMEIDGFYVFEPDRSRVGYWNEWFLDSISSELKKLNAAWEEEICEALSKLPIDIEVNIYE